MNISKETELLYHPTQKVVDVTRQLEQLLKDKCHDSMLLPPNTMLGGIEATHIELDKLGYGIILVHWKPNFKISTKNDPYCSALILKYNTLCKLYRIVRDLLG